MVRQGNSWLLCGSRIRSRVSVPANTLGCSPPVHWLLRVCYQFEQGAAERRLLVTYVSSVFRGASFRVGS